MRVAHLSLSINFRRREAVKEPRRSKPGRVAPKIPISKNLKKSMLLKVMLLCTLNIVILSSAASSDYEVGTWGNFADGAMSITFDDWPASGANSIATTGKNAFNEYNLHMTMFVNTGGMSSSNWEKLAAAFEDGHEVASHNEQHNSSASGLQPSHEAIRQNVPGEKAISIAYPYCTPISANEVLKFYVAGRTCESDMTNNKSPSDMALIQSKAFGSGAGGCPNSSSAMNSYANSAAQQKGWGVQLHHGIGPDDSHGWATTNLDEMKKHLKYLDDNRDKIWTETFGNVARYIKERDAASISEKSSDEYSFTVEVTDDLDDEIFNYPLTIRRPLPDGWKEEEITVTQSDKEVDFSVVDDFIRFTAVPDCGDVVISAGATEVRHGLLSSGKSNSNLIRVHKNVLLISADTELSVRIFSLKGKLLAKHHINANANTASCIALTDEIRRSAFIVKVSNGGALNLTKIITQL